MSALHELDDETRATQGDHDDAHYPHHDGGAGCLTSVVSSKVA
jgi:hypothetical protein